MDASVKCSVVRLEAGTGRGNRALLIYATDGWPACLVLISARGFLEVRPDIPSYSAVKEGRVSSALVVRARNLLEAQQSFHVDYVGEAQFLLR